MSLWLICDYCGDRYDASKWHYCAEHREHEENRIKEFKRKKE